MKFIFFLLLVINGALAAYLWQSESHLVVEDVSRREINRDAIRIVSITDSASAAKTAASVNAARRIAEGLSGAACLEWGGVMPADAPRAQQALATLNLGAKISERRVEEISRYWVSIPPVRDRRTADQSVVNLRKLGIKDVSLLADNTISLGVFSSDDAATRYLAEIQIRGVKAAEKSVRSSQVREHVFTVREPDARVVSRIALMQSEYEGSTLKAVVCAPEPLTAQQTAVPSAQPAIQPAAQTPVPPGAAQKR